MQEPEIEGRGTQIRVSCGICNAAARKIVKNVERKGKVYDVYFCDKCNVGSTLPQPTDDELSKLYAFGRYRAGSGKRFNCVVEFFILLFRKGRRRRIERYSGGGRILDIGCGRGLFLAIMKKAGWEVLGVEFDRDTAAEVTATYGVPVIAPTSDRWVCDGGCDVVTIDHVLEHVRKPAETVFRCNAALKKGGLLVVSVPNVSSLQARVGKRVWFHLDIPYHLYHFSEKGLTDLLKGHSFKIVKVRRFDLEFGPFGWLQTLLNLSGIKENFLYDLLKRTDLRSGELSQSSKTDYLLTLALLPLYAPLSFLLAFFESYVMKRGGTVEIYAVKE